MTKDRWERRITIANILDLVLGVILFAYGFFKGVLHLHWSLGRRYSIGMCSATQKRIPKAGEA